MKNSPAEVLGKCTLAKFRDKKLLRVNGDAIKVLGPAQLSKILQRNLGEL